MICRVVAGDCVEPGGNAPHPRPLSSGAVEGSACASKAVLFSGCLYVVVDVFIIPRNEGLDW